MESSCPNPPTPLSCGICGISFSTSEEETEHDYSLTHHIKFDQHFNGRVRHHCHVCNVYVQGIENYTSHLGGRKHLQLLKEKSNQKQKKEKFETNKIKNKGKKISKTGDDTLKIKSAEDVTATKTVKKRTKDQRKKKQQKGKSCNKKNKVIVNESNVTKQSSLESCSLKSSATEENPVTNSSAVEYKNIIDLPVTSALSNCVQEECPDTMENRAWNSMLPNKYYEPYSEAYSDMNGSSFAHNSLEWYSNSAAYHSDPYLDRPYDYYSNFRGKNSSSRYWENPHFSHPESNYIPQKRWHKERNSSFHSGGNVGYRYKNYNENVSSTAKFNQKENGQKGRYGKVGDKSYTQQLRNDWQDEIIEDSNTDTRKSSESCVESFISSMRLANEKSNIKQCKFYIDKNSDLKKSCQSNENKTCEFPKITRDDKTAKSVSSNDVKFNSEMGRTVHKSTEKCGDTRYSDSRKKRSLLNHKGKIPKISIDLSKSRRHGGSKGSVTEYKVKQKNSNVIVKNKISALTSKKSSIKERLRSGTISSQKRDISKFALKSKENNSCESNDDGITFCGRNLSNINVTLNSDSRTVQVNEQLMQESESSEAFPVKDVINNIAQDSQNVNIPKEIPDSKINVKSEEKITTLGTEEILKGKVCAKEKSKSIKGHLTNVALQRVNARLQSLTKYGKMPSSTQIRHMFFLSSDSDDDPDPKKVCQRNEASKLLINNSGISTSSSDEQESKSEGRLQKWSKIIEQSKHDMSAYSKELVNRLVNYPRSRKEQLKLEKWIQEHAKTKKKLTFPRFNMLLSNSETCKDSLVDEDYAMKNMVSEVVDSLPDDVITSLVNVLNSDFETQNLSLSKETLPDDSNSKIDEIGKAVCWREYSGSFKTHCSSSKDGEILIQEKPDSLQKTSEVAGSVQGVSGDLQLGNEAYQCPDKKCYSEDESERKRNLETENATCQLGKDDSLLFRSPTTVSGSKKRRKSVSAVTEMCKETSSNFQDFNITAVPIKQEPIDISEAVDSSVSDMLNKVSSSAVQKASVSSNNNKTSEIDVHNLTETSSHSSRLCPNDELSQNKSANNFSNILELFANGAIQIKSEIMDPILEDIRKIDLTPLVQTSNTIEKLCNPEIQLAQSVEEQLPSEPSNEVSATDDEEAVLQSTLYGHLPLSSSDLPEDKTKTSEVSSSTDREMVETSMPEVLKVFSSTVKQDASYCPKSSAKTSLSPGPQDMVTELLAISKREEELQSQAYRTEQMISQLSAWLEDWKKTKCEIQQEEAKLRLKRMKLLQTLHGSFQQDCIYEKIGDLALNKARKESLTNQKSTVQIKSVKDVSNFVRLKCNEISEIGKTYSSVGKDENLQMVSKLQNSSGTGIPSTHIGDEADQCIFQCSTNELDKLEKSQMPNSNSVAVAPANSSEMCTFRLPFKNRKSKWPATQNFEHPVSPDSSSSEPDANISFEINNIHTENMEDGAEPFVVMEPICVIEEDIQSSQEKCDEVQCDLDQNICRAEQSREQLSPDNVSSEMACYQRTSVDEEIGSHSMMWPRSYIQHNVDDINIRELVAHASAIIDIKVCGGYLYTCSSDTTAKRFHLEDPTNTVVYCDHGKTVTALYVTTIAVGTCLFTSCHDGYLRCFKAKSGECLNKINMKSPIICMCEGWGKLFLGLHTGQVVLYSLMMGKQLDSLQCASTAVSRIATATQGAQRLLCIAAYDGVVTIWDASTRLLLRCLEGRVKPPCCIQISGNTVYITTTEKAVLIHELLSGKLERMLNWPSSATGLEILENHILSCSFDGLVRCYDKKGWTLHSMYYGAGKAMVMCMTVYRGWVFTGNRRGTVEAFKFDANHVEACQFGRCYFRFGRQEDLQHHVVIDHFPCLNKKVKSCPWRGCSIVFSHKNSDKEKQDHVLQHVPLDICST